MGAPLSDSEVVDAPDLADSLEDTNDLGTKLALEENQVHMKPPHIPKKLHDAQKQQFGCITISRTHFSTIVCTTMAHFSYFGPNRMNDFLISCK